MSFINAFSTSNIPVYLARWAARQAGTDQLGKPIAITPQAFLSMYIFDMILSILSNNRCLLLCCIESVLKLYMVSFHRVACRSRRQGAHSVWRELFKDQGEADA